MGIEAGMTSVAFNMHRCIYANKQDFGLPINIQLVYMGIEIDRLFNKRLQNYEFIISTYTHTYTCLQK